MSKDPEQKSQLDQRDPLENGSEDEGSGDPEEPSFEQPVCPRCGWHNTRLSHTSSFVDSILRLFALRAYRCRSCGNRFRSIRRRK